MMITTPEIETLVRQRSVVGERVPKKDGAVLVTGQAEFTVDLRLPRMLYGRVLHSPHPHARITSIDTSRAEKLPGVKAVICGDDISDVKFGPIIHDQLPLAKGKVRYVGEEIAAVAAETERIATEAVSLIKVEYEILEPVLDPTEALKPGSPEVHEDTPGNFRLKRLEFGDVDRGFCEAEKIYENEFTTQAVHHCTMEPHACVAWYRASGELTIWASTSAPFRLVPYLAKTLGIEPGKIRVIKPKVGGNFGAKSEMFPLHYCSAYLSLKTGRPVKIVNSREEEFATTRTRHPMHIRLKTGVMKDGRLVAREVNVITDGGAYASYGPGVANLVGMMASSLYPVENYRYVNRLVYTNKAVAGAFRGFGNPQITFALESEMDIIATDLAIDPVEFRRLNMVGPYETTPCDWRVTSCGLGECLDKVIRESGWDEKQRAEGAGEGRVARGKGLALMMHHTGWRVMPHDSSAAVIKVNTHGHATLLTGAAEVGAGTETVLAQIAAETLGILAEDVDVVGGDTGVTPMDLGSYGSRVTTIAGNAVRLAALDARDQILRTAALKLDVPAGELEVSDRTIRVGWDPSRQLAFAEAVQGCQSSSKGGVVIGRGWYDAPTENPDPASGKGNLALSYPFGAQVVEIEVDRETGKVSVLGVTSAFDVGRAINPLTLEGQVEGGFHMSMGFALTEQLRWENGRLMNRGFAEYKLPTATDLERCQMKTAFIESNDQEGPFGAKGAAEAVNVPAAPAIANAIYNAIGVRFRELPITPERIVRALREMGA